MLFFKIYTPLRRNHTTNKNNNMTIKKQKNDWKITTERFVAFIDIMGFKNLVAKSTHDEIYKMMKTINDQREENANMPWSGIEEKLVRATTYSDSIIIYSKDDSEESFDSICNTVSGLTYDLFKDNVPHKGALAFGTMTLDTENSIFFGQPLIDSYLLQEELSFYGILIHSSAEKKISLFNTESLFIRNYLCPLKNGYSNNLTIYPYFLDEDEKSEFKEHQTNLFNSLITFRFNTSGYLRKYIDNTENYFNFINTR